MAMTHPDKVGHPLYDPSLDGPVDGGGGPDKGKASRSACADRLLAETRQIADEARAAEARLRADAASAPADSFINGEFSNDRLSEAEADRLLAEMLKVADEARVAKARSKVTARTAQTEEHRPVDTYGIQAAGRRPHGHRSLHRTLA